MDGERSGAERSRAEQWVCVCEGWHDTSPSPSPSYLSGFFAQVEEGEGERNGS